MFAKAALPGKRGKRSKGEGGKLFSRDFCENQKLSHLHVGESFVEGTKKTKTHTTQTSF